MANKSKNDKGKKKKKPMQFAKNKGEVIAMVFVIGFFIVNGLYGIISTFLADNATPTSSTEQPSTLPTDPRATSAGGTPQPGVTPTTPTTQSTAGTSPDELATTSQTPASGGLDSQAINANQLAPSPNEGGIEILTKASSRVKTGKMVTISVAESGRSNPFLPAAENFVPSANAKLHLPPPPKQVFTNSNAAKIMTTTISGIMFDSASPSAIINIAGTDYLVRKGDVVNRYRVLSITPRQVTVQYGSNVYKAGVGQILSLSDVNFNPIANLNRKFGGNTSGAGSSSHKKRKH